MPTWDDSRQHATFKESNKLIKSFVCSCHMGHLSNNTMFDSCLSHVWHTVRACMLTTEWRKMHFCVKLFVFFPNLYLSMRILVLLWHNKKNKEVSVWVVKTVSLKVCETQCMCAFVIWSPCLCVCVCLRVWCGLGASVRGLAVGIPLKAQILSQREKTHYCASHVCFACHRH